MKKLLKFFIFSLLLIVTIRLSCNFLLGYFLKNFFAEGTKCIVHLSDPQLNFFPFKASVENVSIVYPEEKKYGGGFRADKISIALAPEKLWQKELRLENLTLEGASAYSLGSDTGFVNTLAFLFPPQKKGHENIEGSPFLKWISTWAFHITDIHISTNPNKNQQLVLGVKDNFVFWDDVKLDFIEQDFDPKKPYDFFGVSGDFYYQPTPDSKIVLKDMITKGEIGLGKAIFKKSSIGSKAGTATSAEGKIVLGEGGYYDIKFSVTALEEYVKNAFAGSILKDINPSKIVSNGTLSGKLNDPQVMFNLETFFKEGGISYIKSGLEPRSIKADLLVNLDIVALENLVFEKNGERSSDFKAKFSYLFKEKEFNLEKLTLNELRASKLREIASAVLSEEVNKKVDNYLSDNTKVSFDLKGKFNQDRISLNGNAALSDARILNVPVNKLDIVFKMLDENLLEAGISAALLEGKASGKINLKRKEELKGKVDFLNLDISELEGVRKFLPALSNKATATLDFSGSWEEPNLQLAANILSSREDVVPKNKSSSVNLTYDKSKLKGTVDLLDKSLVVNFDYPFQAKEKFSLSLSAKQLSLEYLLASDSKLPKLSAGLTGSFNYKSNSEDLFVGDGRLDLEEFHYHEEDFSISQSDNLLVFFKNGNLDFSKVKFKVQDKELLLKGNLDLKKGWNATLAGNWQLGALFPNQEFFEQLAGDLSLELRIEGDLKSPKLKGPLTLSNFSFATALGKNIVGLTEGVAQAEFVDNSLRIKNISAKMNGSVLNGEGEIKDIFTKNRGVNLLLNLPKVVIEPVDNLILELAGNLRLFRDANTPWVIAGEVDVVNALYEDVISLITIIDSITTYLSGTLRAVESREANKRYLGDFLLDLNLKGEHGLVLETNIAQAELKGNVHVTGSLARPLFDGKVEVIEGFFGLQAKEFDIINASLEFSPLSFDPKISLLSETIVDNQVAEEEHITLAINGTLKNPEVNLRSDSGLKQEQIQALLGFSTSLDTLRRSERFGKQYRLSELINPVSGVSFADRFSSLTSLSSIQFGTTLSPLTGEFIPLVSAKKPLVDKFELNLQSELSRQQAGAVTVDYIFDPELKFFSGWETLQEGRAKTESSGGLTIGVNYQSSFSGYGILPPELDMSSIFTNKNGAGRK